MNKKIVALLLALVLLLGVAVGGTLAWLTTNTESVVNTFTTSDITITLTESNPTDKTNIKMVPGAKITKDPKVKVETGSEPCWLFVKVEESENLDTYITYAKADGWTEGTGTIPANVWYRKITADSMNQEISVLKDDAVTVNSDVTREVMDNAEAAKPTLTFTAYASQLMNDTTEFSAEAAWTNVNNPDGK